ncbi:MAG: nicotinate (nicotinamide) nucleotide adenylyltransferase [Oscillospiraceae bacterium]|nr:nicotinate (nicotinamide) nucleotide adenylyltransferase [Oscillospiraceae bacterium]
MARIGIYGGTFNPPHIGHIHAAQQAFALLKLDKLLLIPDRIAPHKVLPAGSATADQRLQMLKIAAAQIPYAQIDDCELRREGTSYTYLTVQELKERYPNDELIEIMGTDMFLSFRTWRNPEMIWSKATLAVLCRGDKDEKSAILAEKEVLETLGAKVEVVPNEVTAISSTNLRRMLAFDCAAAYLPDGVLQYIRENGLYGANENYRQLPMKRLEEVVISLIDPKRVNHVLGCRDTAVMLAKHWGADETDAARAGILHDITKALRGPLQLTLCDAYGIVLDDFSTKYPKTLHALTGSLVAERIFGENKAVVEAIRHHTTGKADMTLLEKIIYVADYMEPCRDFPGVEKLRELAITDIDAALKLGLEMTLELLKKQGSEVSPASRDALLWLSGKDRCKC